jgi:uncharacterized SAM-binding protein YcdF (DUF218 family)
MSLWPLDGLRSRRRRGTDPIFAVASPQGFASRVRQTLLQPRRRHVLSRCLDVAGIALTIGLFLLVVDFTSFITGLTRQQPSQLRAADGIVALTGGSERISEAFDLLADGMGKRLLITGVNLATSGNALSAEAGSGDTTLLKCCVDLDRNALNTVGNAIEAARWVHERKFHSLIVVTSNYHMPRSLLELRRVLPETELVAYPVVNPNLHLEQWWQDGGSLRLVVSEYLKFLGARLQLRLEPATLGAAKSRLP